MAALVKRGLSVAPFKVGPDFIDPGHHQRITAVASRNLDGWMLSRQYNQDCFARYTRSADVAIVEGVMGLFDGYDGRSEAGSTAQMAKWLGLPVLLVVDARSMARSAAALVWGFENFDPQLKLAGILFNRIGSERHLDYLCQAMAGRISTACVGGIQRDAAVQIPERHLGLVTQDEHPLSAGQRQRLAGLIEKSIDLDQFLAGLPDIRSNCVLPTARAATASQVRIGVARDKAFCFYYPDNLDLLTQNGAELVYFSPLTDGQLPQDLDGLYFGGGYPELFAPRIAANRRLNQQVRQFSHQGMPIYGECGGFMYLCRDLMDSDGRRQFMTGCFPFTTRMSDRLRSLGYREVTFDTDCIIGQAGQTIRGHEFHYSSLTENSENSDPLPTTYSVSARNGTHTFTEGFCLNNTLGSYVHLHFGSSPAVAAQFVNNCRKYRQERK